MLTQVFSLHGIHLQLPFLAPPHPLTSEPWHTPESIAGSLSYLLIIFSPGNFIQSCEFIYDFHIWSLYQCLLNLYLCLWSLSEIWSPIVLKNFFNWFLERGERRVRERERERERETSIWCPTDLCIRWLTLVCALTMTEPTALAYREDALTIWATWPGGESHFLLPMWRPHLDS